MSRRVLVTKRRPDLLTTISTRHGVSVLSLITLTSGLVIKFVAMFLNSRPDSLGINQMFGYVLRIFSNLMIGSGFMLSVLYFLMIQKWLQKTFRTHQGLLINDRIKSLCLQFRVQRIINSLQIGNPNLTSKTIIVPDVYVRSVFTNT